MLGGVRAESADPLTVGVDDIGVHDVVAVNHAESRGGVSGPLSVPRAASTVSVRMDAGRDRITPTDRSTARRPSLPPGRRATPPFAVVGVNEFGDADPTSRREADRSKESVRHG